MVIVAGGMVGCAPPVSAVGTAIDGLDDSSTGDPVNGEESSTGVPSPPDYGAAAFGSGSRLTAYALVADGGAKQLQWFWDEELELECTFAFDPNGTLRCMPREDSLASESAVSFVGSMDSSRLENSSCGMTLARDMCPSGLPEYLVESRWACEPGPIHRNVYTVLDVVPEREADACDLFVRGSRVGALSCPRSRLRAVCDRRRRRRGTGRTDVGQFRWRLAASGTHPRRGERMHRLRRECRG